MVPERAPSAKEIAKFVMGYARVGAVRALSNCMTFCDAISKRLQKQEGRDGGTQRRTGVAIDSLLPL
jgi:hypothetical protein